MFIEMDAIKDVPNGNQNGKLLKIVPLSKETSGCYVTHDFEILVIKSGLYFDFCLF